MFEWDDDKRLSNIKKHALDFNDVKEIWAGYVLEKPSPQDHDEMRLITIGVFEHRHITVISTLRDDIRRIISARRSRKNEKDAYERMKPHD
jgi:uncharacterized DUF497 family protein